MKTTNYLIGCVAVVLALCTASCTIKNYEYKNYYYVMSAEDAGQVKASVKGSNLPAAALPKAVVYKTTCDSGNLVPVTLTEDGESILWYPGIHDVSDLTKPVYLGDGYWLDRQGVSNTTVFTTYTYEQYSSLAEQPTSEHLFKAIKPGCRVKVIQVLDMTPSQAQNNIEAVKKQLGL